MAKAAKTNEKTFVSWTHSPKHNKAKQEQREGIESFVKYLLYMLSAWIGVIILLMLCNFIGKALKYDKLL